MREFADYLQLQDGIVDNVNRVIKSTLFMTFIVFPFSVIMKIIVPFFNDFSMRYFKQAIVFIGGFTINLSSMGCIFYLFCFIYECDKFIGLFCIGVILQLLWILVFNSSFDRHTRHSPALHPFDGPRKFWNFIISPIKRIFNSLIRAGKRAFLFIIDLIIYPLYRKIAQAFKSVFSLLKFILTFAAKSISQIIRIFTKGIIKILKFAKDLLIGLGRSYLGILIVIMNIL